MRSDIIHACILSRSPSPTNKTRRAISWGLLIEHKRIAVLLRLFTSDHARGEMGSEAIRLGAPVCLLTSCWRPLHASS